MVKIWINKQIEEERNEDFNDALIFSILDKSNKSNVKTHIEELWRRFGQKHLENVFEDLLFIALCVFCIDKRIPRNYFYDSWTRSINVNIPVFEMDKWVHVKEDFEKMLNFLSGDKWILTFRHSVDNLRGDKINDKYKFIDKGKDFDGVSLFSGGLDSFCGALKLLSDNKKICFVGFKEYGMLQERQQMLYNAIDMHYKNDKEIILFNANPMRPIGMTERMDKFGAESTSRTRSLLFLAGALAVASLIDKHIPVFIPENGYIGINVPLTDSRNGSCSTRTTHPYFIKLLNNILKKIEIGNEVSNFYAYKTKGEIVYDVKDNSLFQDYANKTISCSHPCQARYDKERPPLNCGYCYPCIIRRASLNKIHYNESSFYNEKYQLTKKFIEQHNKIDGKASDFRAVLLSLKNFMLYQQSDSYLNSILLKHGTLTIEELEGYKQVYKKSMKELLELIMQEDEENNAGIMEYLGIDTLELGEG